jgi:hypothetical protein
MPSLRRLLLPLATLAALAAAAPAQADDMVAELARDTPIAAYGGQLAYSAYDAASGRYTLMIAARDGAPAAAPIATSQRAFDVSLGPDAKGRVVALYTRCRSAEKRCDIYRYSPSLRRESRLGFSSPREDEAWPVQWGTRVAFVRRHPKGGKGEIPNCDIPYVKKLTSTVPPRRLDRGSCAITTGMSLRQSRIVQVTFGSPPTKRFESQVRVLSTRGGAVKVVARQGSGEESNEFVSPNQGPDAIWLTRTGVNPEPTFVLIDLRPRRPRVREVRAQTELTGAFARDNQSGTSWYVEGTGFRGDGCASEEPVPCRLVRASVSPFSPLPHALLPTLTITSTADTTPNFLYGDPFVLSGRLTRKIVHFGVVGRTDPIGGVPVALLARVPDPAGPGVRETFRPTSLTATTDADGRWSATLAAPPSQPAFSAVASSAAAGVPATYAGRGTAGTVGARISLTVSGTSFAGTIAPAQPGRTVKIQRLLARNCQTAQSGQRFCNDKWATVADAPVDANGTGYIATVAAPQSGIYSAALPFEDQQKDPAAYGGRSPDVQVG